MKALQGLKLNRDNAIMVIVDMENEFCRPGGKHYSDTSARTMPAIVGAVSGLAGRCRSAGIPLIYIQSVRTLAEPEFTVFGRGPHLKIGTWAVEIIDELKPQQGEPVIQKFCSNAFQKPDLDQLLQRMVPDPTKCYVIVTGGTADVCVYHAAMGFFFRNYWTVVPVDSIYYRAESQLSLALELLSSPAYPNILLSRSDLIDVS